MIKPLNNVCSHVSAKRLCEGVPPRTLRFPETVDFETVEFFVGTGMYTTETGIYCHSAHSRNFEAGPVSPKPKPKDYEAMGKWTETYWPHINDFEVPFTAFGPQLYPPNAVLDLMGNPDGDRVYVWTWFDKGQKFDRHIDEPHLFALSVRDDAKPTTKDKFVNAVIRTMQARYKKADGDVRRIWKNLGGPNTAFLSSSGRKA